MEDVPTEINLGYNGEHLVNGPNGVDGIDQWLFDLNIKYRVEERWPVGSDYPDIYIIFQDKADAVLFKLTWM